MAATVVLLGSTFNTTSGTHTVVASPNSEDLIVIVTASSGNTATTAPTDNNGVASISYSLVTNALKNSSADQLCVFIRNGFCQTNSSTTFTHAPGTSTGGGLAVYAVRGTGKVGSSVIRQSIVQANHASGAAPAPTFSSAVLTGNPVISAVFNGTSPGGITARSSPAYTRDVDVGYSTPTTGFDSMHINSGETGTAITWGSSSASAFSSLAIELDTTVTKIENQKDNFPGSSLDTTKWYDNTQTGGTQTVSGNAVHLTAPVTTANALAEVESLWKYDLTGSHVHVQATITQVADVNANAKLVAYLDELGNQLEISLINGNLTCGYFGSGSRTQIASVTYNSTTMAWWQIRESGGTISFEYSAGDGVWTAIGTLATASSPFVITLLRTSVAVFDGDSNATAEVGVFSNFNWNVPPNAPTLSSPADTATGVSTTPTLTFTGTDADSDTLEYEVQVDTVNTFDGQGASSIVDSYSEANWVDQASFIYDSANSNISGQSFTGNGHQLRACKFYLYKGGLPTGNATAKLYAHSGVFGTSSVPTGSALATSTNTFDVSTLTGTPQFATFNFDGTFTLVNGTNYCICISYSSSNGTNPVKVAKDTTAPTHAGNEFFGIEGSSYTAEAHDLIFYVYTGLPLLDKLSTTDAGFTAGHPFASGAATTFTVQAGDTLTGGSTYFWRVRAIDPTGSNTYGAFATTRSFTTASSLTFQQLIPPAQEYPREHLEKVEVVSY